MNESLVGPSPVQVTCVYLAGELADEGNGRVLLGQLLHGHGQHGTHLQLRLDKAKVGCLLEVEIIEMDLGRLHATREDSHHAAVGRRSEESQQVEHEKDTGVVA